MPKIALTVNGTVREVDVSGRTPLLWVLRDALGLTGTKFGCGVAQCGACTVHLDGAPIRSCVTPLSAAAGKQVTTIEGISLDGSHPMQQAWIEEQVPQCGYCQSGQIMSACALLARVPRPDDDQIDTAMSGNLCRCGTYVRIRAAIHRAAVSLDSGSGETPGGAAGRRTRGDVGEVGEEGEGDPGEKPGSTGEKVQGEAGGKTGTSDKAGRKPGRRAE